MGTLIHFPETPSRTDAAMAACAKTYEYARASGVWQRSAVIRNLWATFLLPHMIRKAKQ